MDAAALSSLSAEPNPSIVDPPVVLKVAQSGKYLGPFHMPGTGRAPIVFASVHMFEMGTDCAIARCNALLFYVGVEGVKENSNILMANLLGKTGGVCRRVQEVGFESIQGVQWQM